MVYGRLKIGWEENMEVGDVLKCNIFFLLERGLGHVRQKSYVRSTRSR